MPYQSMFSSGPSAPTDGNYHSYFGFDTPANPTQQELSQFRQQQAAQRTMMQPPKAQPVAKSQGLLGTLKAFGNAAIAGERTAATGIARVLPGGTADIQAQQQAADQAAKNVQFIKQQQQSGKINKVQANKIIQSNAKGAGQASSELNKTVKAMPTKGQLAAGFGSTTADILTGGTLPGLKEATIAENASKAQKLLNVAKTEAPVVVGNAAAGGLNAAAGGGDKKQILQNIAAGMVLPEALKVVGKGGAKAVESLSTKPAKELITNVKTQNALEQLAAKQNAKQAKTAVAELPTLTETPKPAPVANEANLVSRPIEAIKNDLQTNSEHVKAITGKNPDSFMTTNEQGITTINTDAPKEIKPYLEQHQKLQQEYIDATSPSKEVGPIINQNRGAAPSGTIFGRKANAGVETPSKPAVAATESAAPKAETQPKAASEAVSSSKPTTKANEQPLDTASIKQQIDAIKNDNKNYDQSGNLTPEAAKQINGLNKQLNVAGERVAKAQKPVTVVNTEPKPNMEVPKTGVSKLSQGVEANAIKKGLTSGFEGKPEYAKVNIDQQAKAASDLLKSDPQRALRIAMGHEHPPEGLLPESVFIAVEKSATKSGDVGLLRQLATESHLTSEASGMGQRIRMLGERDNTSPVAKIKEVQDARKAAFEAKNKSTTVSNATKKEVQAIKSATPKITKETWSSFIEGLKC